jgi:hypothetical protein
MKQGILMNQFVYQCFQRWRLNCKWFRTKTDAIAGLIIYLYFGYQLFIIDTCKVVMLSPEKTIHDCKQCQIRQKFTKLSTTYTIKEGASVFRDED